MAGIGTVEENTCGIIMEKSLRSEAGLLTMGLVFGMIWVLVDTYGIGYNETEASKTQRAKDDDSTHLY